MQILEVLTPILVAVVTAYGAVLVAKVSKLQKDIKTNHGSKNLGDAIDRIWSKVDVISENQDGLITTVHAMKRHDKELDRRLTDLEETSQETRETSQDTKDAVTDTIRVIRPIHRFTKRRKK